MVIKTLLKQQSLRLLHSTVHYIKLFCVLCTRFILVHLVAQAFFTLCTHLLSFHVPGKKIAYYKSHNCMIRQVTVLIQCIWGPKEDIDRMQV